MYDKEIKLFTDYTQKYPRSNDNRHEYDNNNKYMRYIKFIKKTYVVCENNCGRHICPWCRYCKVDHGRIPCSTKKWNDVEKVHGKDPIIISSFYQPIFKSLYWGDCPCSIVLNVCKDSCNNNEMIMLLKGYDSRQLDLNIEKIKSIL